MDLRSIEKSSVIPDLHMHSIFSDGNYTPEQLAEMASKNGVNLVSLTDHDEIAGNERMRKACEQKDIAFVSGVEISTGYANKEIHIVGLNIDTSCPELIKALQETKVNRIERAEKISKKLKEMGYPGALEGAMKFVTNPNLVSRIHFAKWLVDTKAASSIDSAFEKFIGSGRPGFVSLKAPTISQAVHLIKRARGIPVLAHPGRYGLKDWKLQALLDEFRNAGGEVIEVTTGSHSSKDNTMICQLAREQAF
ncbi:MAG: PHP domain-containing protein, partial [Turicimonas muris]